MFQSQQQRNNPFEGGNTNQSRTPNGDLKIDHMPNNSPKRREGYNGGEYVDYEEVK